MHLSVKRQNDFGRQGQGHSYSIRFYPTPLHMLPEFGEYGWIRSSVIEQTKYYRLANSQADGWIDG